jgi:hypothetical protein
VPPENDTSIILIKIIINYHQDYKQSEKIYSKKNTAYVINMIERHEKKDVMNGSYYIRCPTVLPESVTRETLNHSDSELETFYMSYIRKGGIGHDKCDQSMLDHVNDTIEQKI